MKIKSFGKIKKRKESKMEDMNMKKMKKRGMNRIPKGRMKKRKQKDDMINEEDDMIDEDYADNSDDYDGDELEDDLSSVFAKVRKKVENLERRLAIVENKVKKCEKMNGMSDANDMKNNMNKNKIKGRNINKKRGLGLNDTDTLSKVINN